MNFAPHSTNDKSVQNKQQRLISTRFEMSIYIYILASKMSV